MTDRERLIQLLMEMYEKHAVNLVLYFTDEESAIIADKLLAQGVIVPPVKVGDKVWRRGGYSFRVVEIDIHKNYTIFRCGNDGTDDYMAFDISDIGKTVFLTREEAEAAIRKTEGNNE